MVFSYKEKKKGVASISSIAVPVDHDTDVTQEFCKVFHGTDVLQMDESLRLCQPRWHFALTYYLDELG